MEALLNVNKMTHYFGGLRAVYNYDLNIKPQEIIGLIGPNGAGKTTIFNLITGVHTPTEGSITLQNENIKGLAKCGKKPVWGLPGQVVSAMVVLKIVIIPFLNKLKGLEKLDRTIKIRAKLTRNIASAQGRRDFVRVELINKEGQLLAKPVLGKSGLIKTMIHANGLLEINDNVEGLEKDTVADIILL